MPSVFPIRCRDNKKCQSYIIRMMHRQAQGATGTHGARLGIRNAFWKECAFKWGMEVCVKGCSDPDGPALTRCGRSPVWLDGLGRREKRSRQPRTWVEAVLMRACTPGELGLCPGDLGRL